MTENTDLQIILVSGACCQAHLKKLDAAVEEVLKQALTELGLTTNVKKVSLSAMLTGPGDLSKAQHDQIMALFQRYSASFTPAVMINDQVKFAARVPKIEELKTALQPVGSLQPE